MSESLPSSHLESARGLEADAFVYLYRINLYPAGKVCLTEVKSVFWQGETYEQIGIKMGNVSAYADEQSSRPKLQVQNPDAIFSELISQGQLDGASVTRYRVLLDDLLNDRNVFIKQSWRVGRVTGLNRISLSLELRDLTDGPNFVIPTMTFSPPKFPVVRIR
jgi:phage-related protein